MTTIVDLPGGYTAMLRDPKKLRERHKRLLQEALMPLQSLSSRIPADLVKAAAGGDKEATLAASIAVGAAVQNRFEAKALDDMRDAVIISYLEGWTVPEPLPTIENVVDIDPDIYNALEQATSAMVTPIVEASKGTDFGPTPDIPEASGTPFGSSETSNSSSTPEVNAEPTTATPPVAGESSSTEASSVA